MNSLKKITTLAFLLVGLQITLFGQSNEQLTEYKGAQVIEIKTSAHCQDCKDRIEYELTFTKGVVSTEFADNSQTLTVKFKSKKINRDEIRAVISSMGYDADYVKADKDAFNMLPKSCKAPALKAAGY